MVLLLRFANAEDSKAACLGIRLCYSAFGQRQFFCRRGSSAGAGPTAGDLQVGWCGEVGHSHWEGEQIVSIAVRKREKRGRAGQEKEVICRAEQWRFWREVSKEGTA